MLLIHMHVKIRRDDLKSQRNEREARLLRSKVNTQEKFVDIDRLEKRLRDIESLKSLEAKIIEIEVYLTIIYIVFVRRLRSSSHIAP
jgi:hypothetical protein